LETRRRIAGGHQGRPDRQGGGLRAREPRACEACGSGQATDRCGARERPSRWRRSRDRRVHRGRI